MRNPSKVKVADGLTVKVTCQQNSILFDEFSLFQDAETVERLNESGELRKILKPYKVSSRRSFSFLKDFPFAGFFFGIS